MNSTNVSIDSDLIEKNTIVFHQILSLILLFIIIITTIFGNVLVITAILKTPRLRNLSNYLILSLSVTDLIVGLIIMPQSAIIQIIFFNRWTLGPAFCDIIVVIQSVCTTASTLHLVFIAIDRYLSVTQFKYSINKKRRHIFVMILISWTLPLVWDTTTIFWSRNYKQFLDRIEQGNCLANNNPTRIIITSILKFYAPVTLIIILYVLIYRVIL